MTDVVVFASVLQLGDTCLKTNIEFLGLNPDSRLWRIILDETMPDLAV